MRKMIDLIENSNQNISENNTPLIAPNGNKSNLTIEQYKMVRTPEFKNWFGDWENNPNNSSRVVDDNGEPLVVYHYSNKDFDIFNKNKHPLRPNTITNEYQKAIGYDFSTKEGFYKRGDSIGYKCFLNCRKLLNTKDLQNDNKVKQILFDALDNSMLKRNYIDYIVPNSVKEDYFNMLINGNWDVVEVREVLKYIMKKYDGVFMYEGNWKNIKVFKSEQIRIINKQTP